MAVKLLHKGHMGALDLNPGRYRRGGGCDAVDEDGGVCGSEGVAADRRQSCLPFKSLVKEEEVILPLLQGMVFWDFSVPFGAALGEGVFLEEQEGCDGGE